MRALTCCSDGLGVAIAAELPNKSISIIGVEKGGDDFRSRCEISGGGGIVSGMGDGGAGHRPFLCAAFSSRVMVREWSVNLCRLLGLSLTSGKFMGSKIGVDQLDRDAGSCDVKVAGCLAMGDLVGGGGAEGWTGGGVKSPRSPNEFPFTWRPLEAVDSNVGRSTCVEPELENDVGKVCWVVDSVDVGAGTLEWKSEKSSSSLNRFGIIIGV